MFALWKFMKSSLLLPSQEESHSAVHSFAAYAVEAKIWVAFLARQGAIAWECRSWEHPAGGLLEV
jgi:hypothetical protein